jgi:hypothetical protein
VSEWETAAETEVTVPGTKAPAPTCVTPTDSALCKDTCNETASGVEKHAFALGWTEDGVGFLAYVVTQLDQTISYGLQGEISFCVGNVTSDRSTATLHLVRIPVDGSAAEEVLSMPIDRPGARDAFDPGDGFSDPRFVDVRGFGKDLAIGVRTGWSNDAHAIRVLRIDASKL